MNAPAPKTIQRSNLGFTLIEVMVVVAIIGILSAIAYPSYVEYVNRSRRAEAQATLMELSQFMERRYTTVSSYAVVESNGTLTAPALPITSRGGYNFGFATSQPTRTTYTLVATRTGVMTNDPCGDFSLTHTGVRGQVATTATRALGACWRQ